MLPHYAPFKVAEQFRVLEAIAPGRIDLGLGRAPGSDGRTAFALNPLANQRPAQFPGDVRDLMAWVSGAPCPRAIRSRPCAPIRPARRRPRSGCSAAPTTARRWRRTSGCRTRSPGSSPTARPARRRSISTASSISRAPSGPSRTRRCACGRWRPRPRRRRSSSFSSRARFRLLRDRGIFAPWSRRPRRWRIPYTEAELARIAAQRKAAFVGTGAQVAERIDELARRLNVQEMAVVTWAYEEAVRRTSYRLLAEAMGFGPGTGVRSAGS